MSTPQVGGSTGISMANIQSMDIETALMMVQSERTKLLDAQLKSQIEEVQARNETVAKLNDVLSALNKAASSFASDAKATSKISSYDAAKVKDIEIPLNDAIKAAGISDMGFKSGEGSVTNDKGVVEKKTGTNIMHKDVTKGELDTAITTIKGMIDSQSNSQQMDMLRLQSLSNKRNEAFDVMTNFVKKMQDSRSSIIGNMR